MQAAVNVGRTASAVSLWSFCHTPVKLPALHKGLMTRPAAALRCSDPETTSSRSWEWQEEAKVVEVSLQILCQDLQAYSSDNPHVEGAAKLARRARKELKFVEKLAAEISCSAQPWAASRIVPLASVQKPETAARIRGFKHQNDAAKCDEEASAAGSISITPPDLITEKLQGARNNLHGLRAELSTAQQAPGIVAVNKKFSKQVHSGPGILKSFLDHISQRHTASHTLTFVHYKSV